MTGRPFPHLERRAARRLAVEQQVTARVRQAAASAGFTLDAHQERALARLARLGAQLTHAPRQTRSRGLYLWGPVGRGKTWLLDAFVAALPAEAVRRVHFHDFFRQLHAAVHRHRDQAGAIDRAVEDLLTGCRLLCFDELHVHDVGDAMLLTRLLRALFARDAVLLATSNYPPDGLLPNPLYHHLFQPGIDLIEQHLQVVESAGPTDYRRAHGSASAFALGAVLTPGSPAQLAALGLTPPAPDERTTIAVGRRTVPALAVRDDLVWCRFRDLCERPVSALDVLALTDRCSCLVLQGVRRLSSCSPDARQRFVTLVDVLSDRDVRAVLLAEAGPEDLVDGPDMPPDIARTASRLALLAAPADADLAGTPVS